MTPLAVITQKLWFFSAFKNKPAENGDGVLRREGLGIVFWTAVLWIVVMLGLTLLSGVIPIADPLEQDYAAVNEMWSWSHLLGTDHLGRDTYSRILHGGKISFGIAFTAPFIGLAVGIFLGMAAGYFRGWVDSVVGIFIDSILAFPNIILAIAVLFFTDSTSLINLIGVIAFYTIPQFTRISRANTMLFAQRDFVVAAQAQGASNLRILWRELLPNVLVPVVAFSLLVMSYTIVLEGTLSFLGAGIPPPTPTWGRMIAEGIDELEVNAMISFVPSVFMFLTILSLNLIGDRLRRLTDVKSSNV